MNITIGIPAYNEAANIRQLLESLVNQQTSPFIIKQIIVISDGSTDQTVSQAKSVKDHRITVISGRKNLGLANRQNQLLSMAITPILVLLDADILPVDQAFIKHLCMPIKKDSSIGLTSAKITPTPSSNFVGRVLAWHHLWKVGLYESINNQDNIYLCHGRARAFTRRLYTKLHWPQGYGEDAYSYIFSKEQNVSFAYASGAKLICSTPDNLTDHISQSSRFFRSIRTNKVRTGSAHWYQIPKKTLARHTINALIRKPQYALTYGAIMTTSLFISLLPSVSHHTQLWQPAASTKTISFNEA